MESVRRFRCVELADRLESLITARERGEELEAIDGVTYRFVALDAAMSPEWIDQE